MSKKGKKIECVRIEGKLIEVLDTDGSLMKVTRTQREVLRNYKNPEYLQEITKAFSNDHIVADNYINVSDLASLDFALSIFILVFLFSYALKLIRGSKPPDNFIDSILNYYLLRSSLDKVPKDSSISSSVDTSSLSSNSISRPL